MATATKKSPAPSSPSSSPPTGRPPRLLLAVDAIYRFLASLKLAVLSLASLAAVLAYATFFESWYGTSAVQEWIYQTKWFALLLAFLGMNILCAALIRYPWKRRQTGFVITHAGLLILLGGSFYSLKTADDGMVGMTEGESRAELVRQDYPVIRVVPVDPETGKQANEEYRLPFRPGNFPWGPGNPRPRGFAADAFHAATGGVLDTASKDGEVLTSSVDPIKLVVKSHIPGSVWTMAHVADPAGVPMVKLRVQVKSPRSPRPMNPFEQEGEEARWLAPGNEHLVSLYRRLHRVVKQVGPAKFAFVDVDRPELVEDFLNPPRDSGPSGVVRMRYRDKQGKAQTYEWRLDDESKDDKKDDEKKKSVTLPGSDITAQFDGIAELPAGLERLLGEPEIVVAQFKVKRGDGPESIYYAWPLMPMAPSQIPNKDGKAPGEALVEISYFLPPTLAQTMTGGSLGLVEIMGGPDRSLYYRVFGRGDKGVAQVRSSGPLPKGKDIAAFGGNPNMPMTLTFGVDEYLAAGRAEKVCEPVVTPKGQEANRIAASLVAMTVKDGDKPVTKEFWIRRSATFEPSVQRVSFPSGDYDVYYDIDRRPLGFSVKLIDFTAGHDRGTQQAASFESKVRLTDESEGIKDRPVTISMNEPMTHRGYTFYQSNYSPEIDPRTGNETGRFQSIFAVGRDPGRTTKYLGCLLIVLGAFAQFYMRAGLFSDGGKRERAIEEAKARKREGKAGAPAGPLRGDVAIVSEAEETL